jgi:GR25 family glycosyltransferase involved in LPS biosynthesis
MINKYVDKIFVINLKNRTDRLEKFDELSKLHNFEYEIIEAFNGKERIDNNFEYDGIKVGMPYVNESYFRSQVGCLISHLELIKLCKENRYKRVLIFEDDVEFCDDFNSKFEKLMESVNDSWDILYLSGSLPKFTETHDRYSRVSHLLTTHSYMIREEFYDILIKTLSENLFTKPVDSSYMDVISAIKTYVAMPYLTYQRAGFSDIGQCYNDYDSIKKYL